MHGVQPDMFCVGTVSRTQVRCVETVTCSLPRPCWWTFCRNLRLCQNGMDSDTELRSTDKEKSCEFPGLVCRIPPSQGCLLCLFSETPRNVSWRHTLIRADLRFIPVKCPPNRENYPELRCGNSISIGAKRFRSMLLLSMPNFYQISAFASRHKPSVAR